jgi:hemerythrin-like metal-binding protein
MFFMWKDELATGYEVIDNQHKELFRKFNAFQTACRQGKGLDELSNLLSFLGKHVRSHMAQEEQLQIAHNYPGYLMHKKEHDDFTYSLRRLEEQLNADGISHALLIRTNMALITWLTKHFTWTDRDLAGFLRTAMSRQCGELPTTPKRILIAEDQTATRGALIDLFARRGYDVEAVTNGVDLLNIATGKKFDVVITDLIMPSVDGASATEIMQQQGTATPVIALTGLSEADIGPAREKFTRIFHKPINLAELFNYVESLLGK